MLQKSSLISPIADSYLHVSIFCFFFIASSLLVQRSLIASPSPQETTSNLITNNPFVPQKSGSLDNLNKKPAVPQVTSSKPKVLQKYLEFRSIAIINKKKYFSIFNKRINKSFWISENETVENFRVTNYNHISNSITLSDGINAEIIPIITPNESPLNVISATDPPKNQEARTPQMPGATSKKQNDNSKTPPRRRVIPVKR
tara:strand:- start:1859 stop:2461 length:603 start_codon:yes stop_codon:yes gene_type:complete